MNTKLAAFLAAITFLVSGAFAADLSSILLNKELGCSVGRFCTYESTTEGQAAMGMRVKYIGTSTNPSVTVASDGNITLEVDGTGDSEVGSSGVMDVSNASYDTMGEVLDEINASTYWRAILVDSLRSDTANDALYTLAETSSSLTTTAGQPLYLDQAVAVGSSKYAVSLSIGPEYTSSDLWSQAVFPRRVSNPSSGATPTRSELYYVAAQDTSTTQSATTSVLQVWAVKGSTETLIWQEGGANSATDKTWGSNSANNHPLQGPVGSRLLVRFYNASAITACKMTLYGKFWEE